MRSVPLPLGRLLKRKEFLRAAGRGRKCAMPGLVLQAYARVEGDDPSHTRVKKAGTPEEVRVGFTASKKVGKAVDRNRARRRLREAVRQIFPIHAKQATDYVLIARSGTLIRSWDALLRDLEKALQRVESPDAQKASSRSRGPRKGPRQAKSKGRNDKASTKTESF